MSFQLEEGLIIGLDCLLLVNKGIVVTLESVVSVLPDADIFLVVVVPLLGIFSEENFSLAALTKVFVVVEEAATEAGLFEFLLDMED